jgi:dTDP-4-dehydrorhamnose reductase
MSACHELSTRDQSRSVRIWLVGRSGLVGRCLEPCLHRIGTKVSATSSEVDITESHRVEEYAGQYTPDWIVNCAAYTDVDRAERDRDRAFALNARGAANLARAARRIGACLVHLSSDFVFSGADGNYRETDEPHPINTYGQSKLAGEVAVRDQLREHYILRTAWLFGGSRRSDFVGMMLGLDVDQQRCTGGHRPARISNLPS